MTRCISCGRPPSEQCCDICHRVVRALARIADAVGYEETAAEMRELLGPANRAEVWETIRNGLREEYFKEVNTEVTNQ